MEMDDTVVIADLFEGVQNKSVIVRVRRDLGESSEKPKKKSPGSSTGGKKGGDTETTETVRKRKYECVDKEGESAVLESDPDRILEEGVSYILKGFEVEESFQQGQGLEKKIKLEKNAQAEPAPEEIDVVDEGAKSIDVAKDLIPIDKLANLKKGTMVQSVGFVLKKSGGKDGELTTLTVGDHSWHCIEVDAFDSTQEDVDIGDLVYVKAALEGDAGDSKRLTKACWSKKNDEELLKEALKNHFSRPEQEEESYYDDATRVATKDALTKYRNLSRVEIGEFRNGKTFTRSDIKSVEDVSNIKKLTVDTSKKGLYIDLKKVFFFAEGAPKLWYDACPKSDCHGSGIEKSGENEGKCRKCFDPVNKPAHRPLVKASKMCQGRYAINNVMLDKNVLHHFFPDVVKDPKNIESVNQLGETLYQLHENSEKDYRNYLRQAFPGPKKQYDVTLLITSRPYMRQGKQVDSIDVKLFRCTESAAEVMEE